MSNLTDAQKRIRRHMDSAGDTVIAYAAPEVPALGNATPQGLLEELGHVNVARKKLEAVEKILKERISVLSDGSKEIRGDNFIYTKKAQDRTALNQTAAKAYFEEKGILEEYMNTTSVETVTIKVL